MRGGGERWEEKRSTVTFKRHRWTSRYLSHETKEGKQWQWHFQDWMERFEKLVHSITKGTRRDWEPLKPLQVSLFWDNVLGPGTGSLHQSTLVVYKIKTLWFYPNSFSKQSMKANDSAVVTCKRIKAPQSLSTKPTASQRWSGPGEQPLDPKVAYLLCNSSSSSLE